MILPMGMGSFLKSFKSQVEIINKIWRNVYFSAIQNFRNIVKIMFIAPYCYAN